MRPPPAVVAVACSLVSRRAAASARSSLVAHSSARSPACSHRLRPAATGSSCAWSPFSGPARRVRRRWDRQCAGRRPPRGVAHVRPCRRPERPRRASGLRCPHGARSVASGTSASRAMPARTPACWMISASAPVTPSRPVEHGEVADVLEGATPRPARSPGRFSAICWAMTASWFWLRAAARRSMPAASASMRALIASASAMPRARIASPSACAVDPRRGGLRLRLELHRASGGLGLEPGLRRGGLGVEPDLLRFGLGLPDAGVAGGGGEGRLSVRLGVGGLAHVDLELLLLLLGLELGDRSSPPGRRPGGPSPGRGVPAGRHPGSRGRPRPGSRPS